MGERQQTCTCGENGCFWIVTSDCSKFHNNIYKAELATFNAKNQKSCERKSNEWNCSHDYIHTQGTLCVRECGASYGLSLDFHRSQSVNVTTMNATGLILAPVNVQDKYS